MKKNEIHENEFIVVTEGGLESFEAHLHKIESDLAESTKHPHRLGDRNLLMLCYPHPNMENDDFDGFFASPDNVNRLSEGYYGCFAVDLTDYVNTPESRRLSELFEYMKERREITFVLFASDDESGAAVAFAESVKRRTGCKVSYATEKGIERKESSSFTDRAFGY